MMNRLLAIGAFACSAIALGVTLTRPDPATVPVAAPVAEVDEAQVRALEIRVAELENSASELWAKAGSAPRGGATGNPAEVQAELQQLRAQVQSLSAGQGPTDPQKQEAFKAMVRDAQAELQVEQRQQWAANVQQRLTAQATERREKWKQFVTDQRLPYAAEQELTKRLDLEDQKRAAMLAPRTSEDGDGRATRREAMQGLRTEQKATDDAMAKLLTPEQNQAYQQMRRDESPRRGGGEGGNAFGPRRGAGQN